MITLLQNKGEEDLYVKEKEKGNSTFMFLCLDCESNHEQDMKKGHNNTGRVSNIC